MPESATDLAMDRLKLNESLDKIQAELSGKQWTKETCERVAVIVRQSGRSIEGLPRDA